MVDVMKTAGVSFELTEEQLMLQKMAREFTQNEIIPKAAEYDEHATFPQDIFDKAREIGLVNTNIPEEYGGVGASMIEDV